MSKAIFCWGNGQDGQLGTGGSDNVPIPTQIEFLPGRTPAAISTGLTHSLILDSQGLVYSCGNNDHGQLGHNKRRLRPETIDSLEVFKIKQVACGAFHSLALTDDGQVLSWGLGDRGQLGHGLELLGSLARPKFIKAFGGDRIVQIACGFKHCLALGEDGRVWAWGENAAGQLGNGTFVYSHTPFVIASLQGRPIKKIACGAHHSAALSFSGKLYFWGENNFGQLGNGTTTKSLRPQIMKNVAGSGVVDVACGENHTAFLTKDGRAFTFGAGSNGQLGHQGYDHECEPKLLFDLAGQPASLIACGRRHTVVYQPRVRKLFSFGLNGSGQLGQSVGGQKGTSSPFSVKLLEGYDVQQLICGGDQSFVITSGNTTTDQIAPGSEPATASLEHFPIQINSKILKELLQQAQENSNYRNLQRIAETAFSSVSSMNASFLSQDHFDTSAYKMGIDLEDLSESFRLLWLCPEKSIVNTIGNATSKLVNSLLQFQTGLPECMRVFVVVLYNPLFQEPGIYHVVFQKLCTIFVALQGKIKEVLTDWFSGFPPADFIRVVQLFQHFLSFLVTQRNVELDTSVTSCCLILRWFYQINEKKHLIPLRLFQNHELSARLDIQRDYNIWLTQKNQFSFSQYPFLLETTTKSRILNLDAHRQMANEVNSYIFQSLASTIAVPTARLEVNPFLLLKVRRNELLQDCLSQLTKCTSNDCKRPLVVKFEGEEGQDDGGLRKEFFNLVTQAIVEPTSGFFLSDEETHEIWFNPANQDIETYRLLGVLVGMAIYNGCLIDLPFPLAFYKKLLGWEIAFEDLEDFRPSLGKGLRELLDCGDENVEELFGLTFQIQAKVGDSVQNVDLKPNGADIPVTKRNKDEFVRLYTQFLLGDSVAKQFEAFSQGFKAICAGPLFHLFHPTELEVLVRGNPSYNFFDLEKAAQYDGGYDKDHQVIKNFWKIFHSMPTPLKKKFLAFVSGSDRIPVSGLTNMRFVIQQVRDTTRLPAAHTCFNILDLPCYDSITELQEKLVFAINNTEGFGLV